jgi:hypothetical protein
LSATNLSPVFNLPAIGIGYADLLRSEIIANDVLETLANPFLGDGIEITFGEDRVNDHGIFIALFG